MDELSLLMTESNSPHGYNLVLHFRLRIKDIICQQHAEKQLVI